MKRVLFIEAQIKQYRQPFYEQLHARLGSENVQLRVIYSAPDAAERGKHDNCDLRQEIGSKVKAYWLVPGRLVYQPAIREIARADLVVVDHANRFVLNHLLLPLSLLGLKQVAFWGLGENLQADRLGLSEWYKERTLDWVQWWFPYTEGTARYLEERGVARSRITAVHNCVDTSEIQRCAAGLTVNRKAELRAGLGIAANAQVGIFVGMLHRVKAVPFLLEAGDRIRRTISNFELMVAGGGPDEEEIRRSAANRPWIHMVGPLFGWSKAELLASSDIFLQPGRAGLAVLDGFAAGLPVIVPRLAIHGPEIEYVEPGRNGILTEPRAEAYADAVSRLLGDPQELATLRQGATETAKKYSMEAMVGNFLDGIRQCLARPRPQKSSRSWRSRQPA